MTDLSNKKLIILLLLLSVSVLVFAFVYFNKRVQTSIPVSTEGVVESTSSAFERLKKREVGIPKKLIIDSVDIIAKIQPVGSNDENIMETPKNWADTGWYIGSTEPGEEGNVVINGHYDDSQGKPAVFWQLKNILPNDTVNIIDEYGRSFAYRVVDKYYVDIDSPDRFNKVFDYEKGQKLLTLITCGGVWIPEEATYNKRLIVRAQFSD